MDEESINSFVNFYFHFQEYDEEEEEDEDDRRPRKQKKKDRFGGFIIDEAEVDDEVESEDDWEDGAQEIGIVGNELDEHGPTARDIEGRQRRTNLWDNQKEQEIEELVYIFFKHLILQFIYIYIFFLLYLGIYAKNMRMNQMLLDILEMEAKVCLMKLLNKLFFLVSKTPICGW